MWIQRTLTLRARRRGFHLITREVLDHLPELGQVDVGLLHVFIQHTSASLTLNENASPDVRTDMEAHFNEMVPEDQPYYRHTLEGSDDMPAHIRTMLTGSSLSVPVADGRMLLGTWQGLYLAEHRAAPHIREVVAHLIGQ